MPRNKKYFAVPHAKPGHESGVHRSWISAKAATDGFYGSPQGFASVEDAERALAGLDLEEPRFVYAVRGIGSLRPGVYTAWCQALTAAGDQQQFVVKFRTRAEAEAHVATHNTEAHRGVQPDSDCPPPIGGSFDRRVLGHMH